MAKRSTLGRARKLLRARKFSKVIKLLEINIDIDGSVASEYRGSFEFFYYFAVACMYQGDMGGAKTYLDDARRIKMRDVRLLVAQGAYYLHKGDTARAVDYYLEARESDSNNKTAKRALAFLKDHGDAETITRMVETGKIQQFFPPLGIHPAFPRAVVTTVILAALFCAAFFSGLPIINTSAAEPGGRDGIKELILTDDETKNAVETDMSQNVYRYILTERQIKESYNAALKYFNARRDNAAQVEVNRLLNSNAAPPIRQKARWMMEYFVEPTFDSFKDNYTYKNVADDPALYLDCFVLWSGRLTNKRESQSSENGFVEYDLFVGDDKFERVDGPVPVIFEFPPDFDGNRSVSVLGRLIMRDDKKIALKVKSTSQIHQPLPAR